jgi:hypothetical protein
VSTDPRPPDLAGEDDEDVLDPLGIGPSPAAVRRRMVELGVELDALPAGWRERNWRLRHRDEDRPAYAHRVRAQVAAGLAPAEALSFAERLEAER